MLKIPVEPQSPSGCPFDPPPQYRDLMDGPGLSKVRIWNGTEAWLVTRYDDVKEVCASAERFSSNGRAPGFPFTSAGAQPLARSLIVVDSPDHTRLRRLTAAFFKRRRMEEIGPAVERLANDLIDEMESTGSPVDLVSRYAKQIPSLVVFQLLGLPKGVRPEMHERLDLLFGARTTGEQARVAGQDFEGAVTRFVTGEEPVEPGGLIDSIRNTAVQNGTMTLEELRDFVLILIVGGFESTTNTMAEGVALLLLHPEQLRAVREGDALWPNAVEEIIRFTSVTHRGRRRVAVSDIEISGQFIQAGDPVIALENAANRDQRHFEDPDTFDVRRTNARSHLGFGFGPHLCLGAPLARVELNIALKRLFQRLPALRLDVPQGDLDFFHDWHLRGLRSLPVAW